MPCLCNFVPRHYIIKGVLENALYAANCEHAFCNDCISEWLSQHQNCPLGKETRLSLSKNVSKKSLFSIFQVR